MTHRSRSEIRLHDDAFIKAIAQAASGEATLEYYRENLAHQGFAPSSGYDAILDNAAAKLRAWHYEDVQRLAFPSDGDSYVWAFRTDPAWDGEDAELAMVRPERQVLARFSDKRMCLGRFSNPADVEARLVHVGAGMQPADYAGVDVRGKIVLAWGTPHVVFKQAVWERGAAGVVWYRNKTDHDTSNATQVVYSLPWKSYAEGKPVTFCFSLSHDAGRALVALLESGQEVILRASVQAHTRPSALGAVTGVLRGTEDPEHEVWVLGHCNHRNTGGFNNLSGHSATLETARVLSELVRTGAVPPPRRTIRFFWSAEHNGVIYYLHRDPAHAERVFGVINLDMVGGYRDKTGARLRVRRTPHSLPHFINDVGEYLVDYFAQRNDIDSRYVNILEVGGGPGFADPILAPTGSQESFHIVTADFWGPSDQEDLVEGSIGVPTLALLEWPDPYFHTELDSIDLIDPTQIRRVIAFTGATAYYLAQVGPEDLPFLLANALSRARARAAGELRRALSHVAEADVDAMPERYREAENFIMRAWTRERAAIDSLAQIESSASRNALLAQATDRLKAEETLALEEFERLAIAHCQARGIAPDMLHAEVAPDPAWARWIPERTPEIRGPVNLFRHQYGQWWLYDRLGNLDFTRLPLALDGQYYPFEALNFVDGRRTLQEIRDLVSAEYGPAPLEHFREYFDMLAQAGVIHWLAGNYFDNVKFAANRVGVGRASS